MKRKKNLSLFIFALKQAALLFIAREALRKQKVVYVKEAPAYSISILFDNKFKTQGQIMVARLMVGFWAALQFDFYDVKGNLTSIEPGSLKLKARDEGYLDIKLSEGNPAAFELHAVNKSGATVIDWEADADRGQGVVTIRGEIAVEIEAGLAVGAGADLRIGNLVPIEGFGQTTVPETTAVPETTVPVEDTTDEETTDEFTTDEFTTVPETTEFVEDTTVEETTDEFTTEEFTTEELTTEPLTTVLPEDSTEPETTSFVEPLL